MQAFLTLGGYKLHVKDLRMTFFNEYVLYVCYGKLSLCLLI